MPQVGPSCSCCVSVVPRTVDCGPIVPGLHDCVLVVLKLSDCPTWKLFIALCYCSHENHFDFSLCCLSEVILLPFLAPFIWGSRHFLRFSFAGPNRPGDVDSNLLMPIFDIFCCFLPGSWRQKLRCGVDYSKVWNLRYCSESLKMNLSI